MLEATSASVEKEHKIDFAKIYKESPLYQWAPSCLTYFIEKKINFMKIWFFRFYLCHGNYTIEIVLISCYELLFAIIIFRDTVELVQQLSEPQPDSKDLHFPTRFPQNFMGQFMACLWKQHLSYWRSPEYNLARFVFMILASILFGAVFWQKGKDM